MFRLKDRIPYADGSIAKEIVMQNHSGLSLLMAVDKGLEIPTHTANADVLVQVIDGSMEFNIEDKVLELKEGDVLTMTPGVKHSLKATERFKVLVTKLNA